MSFLQPILLAALPLVALPILIHLINQRRYQTTRWAAMMFLLAASRMSRGYARLRQWLILAFRMLAIAGLIFAVSRPLASGWLGLAAGGRADTTIVLLDRSPSMQQQGAGSAASKLETGRQQLVHSLRTLGSSRWVLIESAGNVPRELESPDDLLELPCTGPTSAEADVPAMLQTARDYVRANRTGRTEIWICSDLRENDWHADSGRWQTLRDSFLELPQGVRFHLLAYPETASGNVAVRVTDVRRRETGQTAELLVSLQLSRAEDAEDQVTIPVQFEIQQARTETTVQMTGPQFRLKDFRLGLEGDRKRGWGRVSIPADANPADNDFYFAFDELPPRKTILVSDDPQAVWPLELAAAVSPDPAWKSAADAVPLDQLKTVSWEQVSLVLWQAPLPQGEAAQLIQAFVGRGGQAVFLPATRPAAASCLACVGNPGSSRAKVSPSKRGEATKTCWHTRSAATHCPWANCRSGGTASCPASSRRWPFCVAASRCWLASPATGAAPISGRQPLLRRTRRWRPAAWFSMLPSSVPWLRGRPSWATRATSSPAGRRPASRRRGCLWLAARRFHGLRLSRGSVRGGRPLAGRPSRGGRGSSTSAAGPARGRTLSRTRFRPRG